MAALGPDDLVLHAGTIGPRGVRELCEAAEAGGFRGVTIYAHQYHAARAGGLSDGDIAQLLEDHGLVVSDLDAVVDWVPGVKRPPGMESERFFYEMCEHFGGTTLNLAHMGGAVDPAVAARSLGEVCDRAADYGLTVTVEYLPWTGIPDAASAWSIVEACGRENAGLTFDAWHTFRSGTTSEVLAGIPGERWAVIQLDDAPRAAETDLVAETLARRRLPGEGDAPVAEWLALLRRAGCTAPTGVEVFSDELNALPPAEVGRRCGDAARATIAAAAQLG